MSNAPIDLYYWPTPNGWKISIALEEMGLDYKTHFVNIGAGDQFKPDFLKIAPNNRMPAIVDPDGPDGAPISIFESGAILQYLARKTGKFGGPTERDRIAVDQWLMWQMGGLGPMAGQAHHFLKYAPAMSRRRICPMPRSATATRSPASTVFSTANWPKTNMSQATSTRLLTWQFGVGPHSGKGNNRRSTTNPIWRGGSIW